MLFAFFLACSIAHTLTVVAARRVVSNISDLFPEPARMEPGAVGRRGNGFICSLS
jgi:hypothetical protein